MRNHGYPRRSSFDPRLELRGSVIHGRGVFATSSIAAGERLQVVGGTVFTTAEKEAGAVRVESGREYNEGQLDDDLWIIMPVDEGLNYFFNHSCDPNFSGECARRDIDAGEELTIDYAIEMADDSYELTPCQCGTALCRRRVTGNDWRRPELQQRYRDEFPPFLQRRIEAIQR